MGTLYIVSTPIGNLEDITVRAIKTLLTVDIVACEDTRRTGQLLSIIGKNYEKLVQTCKNPNQKLVSYYDEIELRRAPELLAELESGKSIALVSDAGTPLINDPGFLLVRQARKQNISVVSVPGASALLAALVSSGLAANTFMYLGYPPEKTNHRLKFFQNMFRCFETLEQKPTLILYCAPHKLADTLVDLKSVFGDIEVTIARELTKIHETIWHGSIESALNNSTLSQGELVILFQA